MISRRRFLAALIAAPVAAPLGYSVAQIPQGIPGKVYDGNDFFLYGSAQTSPDDIEFRFAGNGDLMMKKEYIWQHHPDDVVTIEYT